MRFFYLKNSIKNLYRSKIKTLFFMLLVFILTVISCISLSVWVSIESFLASCDEFYDSIAVIEYMSPEYPDEGYYDSNMHEAVDKFDESIITNDENVISFDANAKALAYINNYERFDHEANFKSDIVAIAGVEYEVGEDGYVKVITSLAKEPLYANYKITNRVLSISGLEAKLNEMYKDKEPGVYNGSFVFYGIRSDIGSFRRTSIDLVPCSNTTILNNTELDKNTILIEEITGREEEYSLEGDSIYAKIARTLYVARNSVTVTLTNNIEVLSPFNQQEMTLVSGRYFDRVEYEEGSKAIIINEILAKQLELTIGDDVTLSISVIPDVILAESYWDDRGFDSEDSYEIVGIIRSQKGMVNEVFIPGMDKSRFSVNQVGYTLGTVHLNNSGADEFYKKFSIELPERFRVTIYDQGYAQAAKPLEDIHSIAMLTAVASMLATLVVLLIYSYLYVYRQRIVSNIMVKLGTGKLGVYRYFLYGMFMVSLASVSLGVFISDKLFIKIKDIINDALSGYDGRDLRFSNSNLSIINNLDYSLEIDKHLFIMIAISIIVLTILCGIYFSYRSLKPNKKVKKIVGMKKNHYSSTRFRGTFKYVYLSMFRGGLRSVIVVVLIASMILFLGQLTSTLDGYKSSINRLQEDTSIEVQFTDIKGRQVKRSNIEAFYISDIIKQGIINKVSLSRGIPYRYLGLAKSEGVDYSVDPLELPSGSFAKERFISEILMGPQIIFTNDIDKAPQFYYGDGVDIEFLDGYNRDSYSEDNLDISICVVPDTLAMKEGLTLGDTITVYQHWEGYKFKNKNRTNDLEDVDMLVVGIYKNDAAKDYIYSPLEELISIDSFYADSEDMREYLFQHVFDSGTFVIPDASKLDEFRDYLTEYGFSESTKIRTHRSFVVINDKTYVLTLDTLNQQLKHIQILYPILYVLVGIAGFIVAFLVIHSRQKELSIMRVLGSNKYKTFMTFLVEQCILSFAGLIIGLAATYMIYGYITSLQALLTMAISCSYLFGTMIGLGLMNRNTVMKMLKVED